MKCGVLVEPLSDTAFQALQADKALRTSGLFPATKSNTTPTRQEI